MLSRNVERLTLKKLIGVAPTGNTYSFGGDITYHELL